MTAYYNELDPFAAAWLRELIAAGLIAPGVVDTRSIEDVRPSDLEGFSQCHFFAGIGVWSYALRLAGWPDNRPIWTASCPCQPFSASGRRSGFDDDRHLWPHLQWLIEQRKPAGVIGEQVASKSAEPWVDLVQADLEALGYAFGCVAFPSAGVGAPHIRDRAYWVGIAGGEGLERLGGGHTAPERQRKGPVRPAAEAGESGGVADLYGGAGRQGGAIPAGRDNRGDAQARAGSGGRELPCEFCGYPFDHDHLGRYGCPNCEGEGLDDGGVADRNGEYEQPADDPARPGNTGRTVEDSGPGPTNGFWRAADWLHCRDGKWRPVMPGAFPLAHGAPARVGRLRGYGNAINAEAARAFIECLPLA